MITDVSPHRATLDAANAARPRIQVAPDRWIGEGEPCFIVAEVGQNHNGDIFLARQLVDQVALCQADAVKLCKRHIKSDLTLEAHQRPYPGPHSFGPTYGQHREFLELAASQYAELKQRTQSHGLVFFATACDQRSVDDLELLGVSLYKIASRDLTNLPLLDYVARTQKPVVLSCGMASLAEIAEALAAVRRHHSQIVLLQCTSAYPTSYDDVNLRALAQLRRRFGVLVGISDHTPCSVVPIAAVALGAVLVEKHITLGRQFKGTDHACSLEVDEFYRLVRDLRHLERALGDGVKRVPESVAAAQAKLGRCLVSRESIAQGTLLTEALLCLKSGGAGLKWRERQSILGRIAACDIPADTLLLEGDFA